MSSQPARDPRPVLFVTGNAPPSRIAPFTALHEREDVVFALFGGSAIHAMEGAQSPPFPHLRPGQRAVHALAASGRFRAVVCGTGGRAALPAAYLGARRAGVPFVLWASIWAHPRSLAGAAGYLPVRQIYRRSDAVVTYGPHVSAYVRSKGARNVFEAPQAVDNGFWGAQASPNRRGKFQFLFVGRPSREKGTQTLQAAWRASGLAASQAALVLVGGGPFRSRAVATSAVLGEDGVVEAGTVDAVELRNFYAGSDVCVIPSVPTRTIRETWSLVANEAMNQGIPIIASDSVGAAAGGLVRDGRNGLVVRAGDPAALAGAMRRLHADPELRERLGAAAREDVQAYTADAWAAGISAALDSVGVAKRGKGA